MKNLSLVSFFVFVAVMALLLTSSTHAYGQDPSAEDLKNKGNQAMMELNYAEALSAYKASLEKNPSDIALQYNIGRAHQARGDYPAALDALTEFDKKAPADTKAKVPSLSQLITDIRGHVGELNVRCSVDVVGKATVVIGTPSTALTRVEGCTAAPKSVRFSVLSKTTPLEVRLESESSKAPPVNIIVEGGAATPLDVVLVVGAKTNAGLLRIMATPANAVVSIDASPRGNPPLEVEVKPGSHTVDVSADGYEGAHTQVVMEAGGKKEINLTLEKTPPITKRWWFWAGTGAIVAGLVTMSVILIVQPERDSTRGTIEPGVIKAPLTF